MFKKKNPVKVQKQVKLMLCKLYTIGGSCTALKCDNPKTNVTYSDAENVLCAFIKNFWMLLSRFSYASLLQIKNRNKEYVYTTWQSLEYVGILNK